MDARVEELTLACHKMEAGRTKVVERASSRSKLARVLCIVVFIGLWASGVFGLDPERSLTQYGQDSWIAEDGLPQNTIQTVLQGRDGYIWIGTQSGLVRFDGVRFTVFDSSNVEALRFSSIMCLAESPNGDLWMGTDGRGVLVHREGRFEVPPWNDMLPSMRIMYMIQTRDGSLWLTPQGEGVVRIHNGKVKVFTTDDGLPSNWAWTLFEDHQEALWAGTGRGLARFREGKFEDFSSVDGLFDNAILTLGEGPAGTLWVGTVDGLFRNVGVDWRSYSTEDGLLADTVLSLLYDSEGCLWIGSYGGLNRFRGDSFEGFGVKDGLSNEKVWSLHEDAEGSLWIGTTGGLNRLRDTKFITISAQEGLSHDVVWSVVEDREGYLWVGTDGGGLNRIGPDGVTVFDSGTLIPDGIVSAVAQDDLGTIWLAPEAVGMVQVRNGRLRSFPSDLAYAGEESFTALMFGRDETMWAGGLYGLYGFRPDGSSRYFGLDEGLSDELVICILEARNGDLWVGTDGGGLNRLSGEKIDVYTTDDGLGSDSMMCLQEDEEGTLWIGTTAGLTRLRAGAFVNIDAQMGLYDNSPMAILEDDRGYFWMSSNTGIFRASKRQLNQAADGEIQRIQCEAYGVADGMKSRECNGMVQPCAWKMSDGRLSFATLKGVSIVDPDRLPINGNPPPVVIEEVLLDGVPIPPGEKAVVEPGVHRFEFRYTGLSLIAPEKIQFKYRLEGLDESWVFAGTERTAAYAGIPPGDYHFRVIACNNDGVWNNTGATFSFELQPHFYQTFWFYLLAILVLILASAGAFALRMRQMKARQRELERLVKERTAELGRANETLKDRSHQLEDVNRLLEKANKQLERLSLLDSLTGISNRRHFGDVFAEEWRRGVRLGTKLSVVMIDVDYFKDYNDTYGHTRGDHCLTSVAAVLAKEIHRAGDLLARYGGDEFVVVLPNSDVLGAAQVAERMRAGVEAQGIETARSAAGGVITVSMGTATCLPQSEMKPEELLNTSDRALYKAKERGRNKVVSVELAGPQPEKT